MDVAVKVMSDKTPIVMNLSIVDAWMCVSTLQLGTRHPHITEFQRGFFLQVARKFEAVIVEHHPEAKPLIDMGWDARFDIAEGDSLDSNAPEPEVSLKPINNCWTIYADGSSEEIPAMATLGRPQDWGDPRWTYGCFVLEANGFRNTCHCWIDLPLKPHELLQQFATLMTQIVQPGHPVELSGRDFLNEIDFWRDEWGVMPPYYDGDEWDDINYD